MKNITVSRDKVEQWLEDLEYSDSDKNVIAAIKQALAAPVQEPVAYIRVSKTGHVMACAETGDFYALAHGTKLYTTPPAQPAPTQDIPDLIAGALGVSRGTAYDMMREALKEAAPVQEPVYLVWLKSHCAWTHTDKAGFDKTADDDRWMLYPTPPAAKRPWVGLDNSERLNIWEKAMIEDNGKNASLQNQPFVHFARAIEAKLKEKNT